MGYSTTEIAIKDLEQTLASQLILLNNVKMCKPSIGTTEETMYKMDIDFDEIDYLECTIWVRGSGATNGRLRLYIDSVEKIDQIEAANADYEFFDGDAAYHQVDCTSITGVKELKITGDNDDAAGYTYAIITVFARDS
jgi:hypothetical protein